MLRILPNFASIVFETVSPEDFKLSPMRDAASLKEVCVASNVAFKSLDGVE